MSESAGPEPRPRRRRRLGPILALAFIVVPLVEIFAIVQVGQVIGAWWTIVLLVVDSLIGAWIVRREGARAWRALQTALQQGRMPATELADGALILVGGTLLLTPGFVTDAFGVLVILPLTRPIFRRALAAALSRRLVKAGPMGPGGFGPGFGGGFGPGQTNRPGPRSDGSVVPGEVVEE